jgi:large subunit ribosomal protein L25
MKQKVELEIQHREITGKATKNLRKTGLIPANIFGHHKESQAVQLEMVAFERLQRSQGTKGIISLHIPGEKAAQTALVRHVQRDPRTGKVIHIDFFRVSMTERLNVKVTLHFIGEAPAVKNENGVLLHLMDTLEVECMAQEIPEHIDIDVTSLVEIDDILHAEDIHLPANFKLITDPKEGVAKVAATRAEKVEVSEEELAPVATTTTAGAGTASQTNAEE